jgi:hypothetical protein
VEEHSQNYYHYYSDIEEHFVRCRRKFLYISCLDWALITSWRESGIPLHVVLRGIDRAFTTFDAQKKKTRLVNSLFYCQQAVQECFVEYGESHVGQAPPEEENPESECLPETVSLFQGFLGAMDQASQQAEEDGFPSLKEVFEACRFRLQALLEEIQAAGYPDWNRFERDLQSIEISLAESISTALGEEAVHEWQHQAERELRPYKKRVDPAMYEKILKNYIHRCARQHFGLPPFSIHTI